MDLSRILLAFYVHTVMRRKKCGKCPLLWCWPSLEISSASCDCIESYKGSSIFSLYRSVFSVYCNTGGQQFKRENVNVLCFFLVLAGPASRSAQRPVIGRWRRPRCCSPHPNSFLAIRPHHPQVWGHTAASADNMAKIVKKCPIIV